MSNTNYVSDSNLSHQNTGTAGIFSLRIPDSDDINPSNSHWQPTNDADPDLHANIVRESCSRLANSCEFFSDDALTSKLNEYGPNPFSLLHHNIRGIISSYTEIHSFTEGKGFSIIGLCETFLTEDNKNLYTFPGYHILHKTRPRRRGGGVSLLIRDSLSYLERPDLSGYFTETESIFIELPRTTTSQNKKIIIGELYRPPNLNKAKFIEELELLLHCVDSDEYVCYLMGDFNIDLIRCNEEPHAAEYLSTYYRHCFFPLINRPTRAASGTLLDHIFTNSRLYLSDGHFFSGIVLNDLSDHYPVVHICDMNFSSGKSIESEIEFKLVNEITISAFKEKLMLVDWSDLLLYLDVNLCYNQFIDKLTGIYNESFPTIKRKHTASKKPWITQCLINSIKEKNHLYEMSIRAPCEYNRHKYRRYRNKLNHLLRIAERNYAKEQLLKYNCNLKRQWQIINTLIEKKKQSPLPDSMLVGDGAVPETDTSIIADEMNKFFVNSGAAAVADNPTPIKDPLSYGPVVGDTSSMYIKPVNTIELLQIINELKDSAGGNDGIKPKVIKHVKHELAVPLLHLVNLSLKTGVFPDQLKQAIITPVFKKGSHNLINNYRPISVLNVFSKIFEKVMYRRLMGYLDSINLLYYRQFGFRRGHSTEMAVTEIVSIITRSLNENSSCLGVNMDLSKAFDSIDHGILCKKLHKYGIRHKALEWFQSYLSNRTQQVKYNSALSTQRTVIRGVPQGSNLGPLLFLIYVNDMQYVCTHCEPIMYADDCNIFFKFNRETTNSISTLVNQQLKDLSDWFSCNYLSLNVKKTNFMVFSGKRKVSIGAIMINGVLLEQVNSSNFLGITIDSMLSWKAHIQKTCGKISKSIGVLRKINKNLSKSTMKQLYNSIILPHLNYGITIWGSACPTTINSLYLLQKKSIKIALRLPWRTSTNDLFRDNKILPIHDLYKLFTGVFVFKHLNSLLPSCFREYFVTNAQHHAHHTRSASLYRLPLFHTTTAQRSILYQGPKLWSSIPLTLRQSNSLSSFRYGVKRYLATIQ